MRRDAKAIPGALLLCAAFGTSLFAGSPADAEPPARIRGVESLTDPRALAEIALTDKDADVRSSAVLKIKDDEVLSRIAIEDPDRSVRMLAVGRIGGQEFLERVAARAPSDEIRAEAVGRLTDPSSVDEFAASESWLVRKAAVSRTNDKSLLVEMALDDPDPYVREEAVGRIEDQDLLARIAIHDSSRMVRYKALKGISGQDHLVRVAIRDRDGGMGEVATGLVTDSTRLLEIARKTEDPGRRELALSRMKDKDLLGRLAKQDPDDRIRLAAVEQLSDQGLISELAASDPDDEIRLAAIRKTSDQKLLARIARAKGEGAEIRAVAVPRLTDQALLTELARSDPSADIRWAAVNVMNDMMTLGAIARSVGEIAKSEGGLVEKEPRVRARAASRLTDQSLLGRVANTDPDASVRKEAVSRISDPGVRRRYLEDRDGAVRAAALAGLPDDQQLFTTLALKDPDSGVRADAASRLIEPALLGRICRDDASPLVRKAALARLSDPAELSKLARTHPDWIVRRDATGRIADAKVLAGVASSDADPDVRAAALRQLDEGTVLAIAQSGSRTPAREQAVGFLNDPAALERIAAGDPVLRGAAVDRTIELSGGGPDPRIRRIRLILLDHQVVSRYGTLDLDFRVRTDEKRYIHDEDEPAPAPPKGKVLVESVSVEIGKPGKVLFRKDYRGDKARKYEAFSPGFPVQDGYFLRINPAEIDIVEIAMALLRESIPSELRVASASKNKYIAAAATALADAPRRTPPAQPDLRHLEEDDDDD